MEKLANICIVLSLFFVRLVSFRQPINVTVNPNKTTFYSEFRKKPKETITCESDCPKSRNCIYAWYIFVDRQFSKNIFSKGNVLFLNEVAERNNTYRCQVLAPDDPQGYYGYSKIIKVIIQDVENDESLLSDQSVVIGICGAAAVLLIAIILLVGILSVKTKQKQNKIREVSRRSNTTQEKDRELELTENNLYITADNITEMPPSNSTQNNTPTTGSGNDVYAVVNKPRKTEDHSPVYAEVRNSQAEKDKPAAENNPSGKEENKLGQNVNKDGMDYVEIDFKDMPSNGKSTMQGVENKTLYADIDSIKQTETQPTSGEKESLEFQQNEKESHAE